MSAPGRLGPHTRRADAAGDDTAARRTEAFR